MICNVTLYNVLNALNLSFLRTFEFFAIYFFSSIGIPNIEINRNNNKK